MTDSELVERARDGDADAFGELATRHGRAVYRAALAALGSPAEAEDVAQEASELTIGEQKRGRTLPADASTAWRPGLHCAQCCAGLIAILLVLGRHGPSRDGDRGASHYHPKSRTGR